ncbi:T9SS type A sorting domain-containing protein [Rubrivirga sp.]|uniref:T9SS type A sorting domain-containing protein n=1 Tax=Rubrivirga sp. TaxID=1885344 RepID=UPI003B518B43
MPRPLRSALVLGLVAATSLAASAQEIRVLADAPQHRFDGAGVSFGLFLGHHYSMPAAGQDEAVRLIAEDLDLAFLQDYPDGEIEPADDPGYYDRRADYVRAARAYRPGLEFSLVTNKYPSRLRTEITVNGRQYLVLDVDREGIYDEVAEWYFSLFQAFAERGVSVEVLNVVNEPDLDVCGNDPLQCRPYHYGYGDDTRRGVAEVFAQAVPAFLALFDDPDVNTLGMAKPRIMGPSTIAPNGALDFIRYMKAERPEAWDQIDIVATHQYINGVRGDLFQALRVEAEGKPIWQSETHASKTFGPDALRPGHRTSLSLAQLFGAAVNFGTSMWAYFETNYPNPADPDDPGQFNPGGLLSVPFNTTAPEPYKHYYAFRQLTSTQPDSSDVLDYTASAGRRADVVAFRKAGQDTVYVTVTNTGGETKSITLEVEEGGGLRTVASVATRITDADRSDEPAGTVTPPAGTATLALDLGPYSIHTYVIALGAPVAADDGPDALAATLAAPAPNPAASSTTLGYALAAPGDVALTVHDALGREVARLAEGARSAGPHRVAFDTHTLASGVYVVRLRAGGAVTTQRMTVIR